MARCIKCGRSGLGITRFSVKLKDKKYICFRCLKELGYDHPLRDASLLALETSEELLHPEIKWERQRLESSVRRAGRLGITPDQYDALDRACSTDFEMKLFSRICALLEDEGCDSSVLVVAPGTRGSLCILLGDVVLMEYKGEPQVKWIRLADDPESKIRFGQLSRLNSISDRLVALYREIV